MAVTTAQVNAGKATILGRLFVRYPRVRAPAVRIAVQAIKNGNQTEREVGKAILREAYQAIYAIDPVGHHPFKHWLYEALGPDADDPTTGVDQSDAFEAEAVTVN